MSRNLFSLTGLLLLGVHLLAGAADVETYAKRIAPLIDPAKLATLGERGANSRVQKYVAHLAEARQAGIDEAAVVKQAVADVGWKGEAATLTAEAMLRNLNAQRLQQIELHGAIHRARATSAPEISDAKEKQPTALTHWITTSTGKRHNRNCRYYQTSQGRMCEPNKGVACKICGG